MADLESVLGEITAELPEVSAAADSLTQKYIERKEAENEKDTILRPDAESPKKKRGRPPKNAGTGAGKNPSASSRLGGSADREQLIRDQEEALKNAEQQTTAETATFFVEKSGEFLASEQGTMQDGERMALTGAFYAYFKAKDIRDFPPGVSLAVFLAAYYARVITAEKAQPKVVRFFSWVKSKFGGLNARFNRRNDSKRENDTSKENSESVQGEGDQNRRFRPFK